MYRLVVGILIALGQGSAYVLSGMYGDVKELGVANAFLIVVQLVRTLRISLVLLLFIESFRFLPPLLWYCWTSFCKRDMEWVLESPFSSQPTFVKPLSGKALAP